MFIYYLLGSFLHTGKNSMLMNYPKQFSRYFLIICLIYINAHVNSNLLIYSTCIWRFGTLLRATGTPGAFWRHTAYSTVPVPSAPGLSRLGTQANQAPGMWHQPRSPFPEGCGVSICFLLFLFLSHHFYWSQVALFVRNPSANAGDVERCGFHPGVRKIPGEGNPTPVFLPGEFHGQRRLQGYRP